MDCLANQHEETLNELKKDFEEEIETIEHNNDEILKEIKQNHKEILELKKAETDQREEELMAAIRATEERAQILEEASAKDSADHQAEVEVLRCDLLTLTTRHTESTQQSNAQVTSLQEFLHQKVNTIQQLEQEIEAKKEELDKEKIRSQEEVQKTQEVATEEKLEVEKILEEQMQVQRARTFELEDELTNAKK